MALRSGMVNLIKRVRVLTGAGTSEYSVSEDTYWSDQQIQDILDSNVTFVIDDPLTWREQVTGGGTVEYLTAQSAWRDLEEAASGTARWIVRQSTGEEVGTANYTPDYRQGQLVFSADQGGTAYYLTTYSYDVHAAAADLWLERLAYFNEWYDFSADNQTFTRSQAWEHATVMEKRLRQQAGKNVVLQAQGDLRQSQFVRSDL